MIDVLRSRAPVSAFRRAVAINALLHRRSETVMQIGIGIHHLRPRGGQEDHCIRIAEALVARGHDVTLFSSDDTGDLAVRTVKLSQHAWQANHVRAKRFAADFLDRTRSGFDRTVAFQPIPGVNVLFIGNDLRNRKDTGLLTRLTPRHRTYSRLVD